MTKEQAIKMATDWFDSGAFRQQLARRIALATESQRPGNGELLQKYLLEEIGPQLSAMGFTLQLIDNPQAANAPFLIATKLEDSQLPTVLFYGHGDVVFGDEKNWRQSLSPWRLTEEDDHWYGRGSADNKGQHSVNLAALAHVFQARGGKLGFNCKLLFESGEEVGSPGLAEFCQQHRQLLASDLFIASDGPRVNAIQPTLFLGSRGCANFRLTITARKNAYHSGNWGGVLANPATQLANALSTLVNGNGQLQVAALKPDSLTAEIRAILTKLQVGGMPNDPPIDLNWGESGLTPAERLYGWNTLEVLTLHAGNPEQPMNAIPASATAVCQLRFVVGTDWQNLVSHLKQHLNQKGFNEVEVELLYASPATRLDPNDPLVLWALSSISASSGKQAALLPNLGGSLPNDVFAEILGLPTLWIPHSYPACGQHSANEHLLKSIAREGLQIMTALLWEFADKGTELIAYHRDWQGAQK